MSEVCQVCGRLSNHAFHDRDALPRPTRVKVASVLGTRYAYSIEPPPIQPFGKRQAISERQKGVPVPSTAIEMELPIHQQCIPAPGHRKMLQKMGISLL